MGTPTRPNPNPRQRRRSGPEDQDDPELEHLISTLTSDLEQQLTALLHHHARTHTPAGHGRAAWDEVRDRRLTVLITVPPHGRGDSDSPGGDGPSGGSGEGSGPSGGSSGPPGHDQPDHDQPDHDQPDHDQPDHEQTDNDGHPEPEPPSESDLLWNDHTLDRTEPADQSTPPPEPDDSTCPAGCPPPERAPQDPSSWSHQARTRAHARLTTAAVDERPLDSRSYALPRRLSRFIKTRDLTCTFPACRRLARDCQSDHLVPWPQGPSTARNTSSECTHHHQAKHHYFTVTREQDGSLRWTTPLDRSYLRRPRPLLRGW